MPEKVTLENLAGGAAVEKFNAELARVLENIRDINTEPTAAREVVLKVKIKPDANRELAFASVSTEAKLAPDVPITTQLYLAQRGEVAAFESNMHQIELQVSPKSPAVAVLT